MGLKIGTMVKNDSNGDSEARTVPHLSISQTAVRRILVAVDFSEGARRAVEIAATLGTPLGAELMLLHVFEGVPGELKILEAAFVDTSFREEAQENLQQWQKELALAGVPVKAMLREGAAIDREIVAAAEAMRADMLVMGPHGRESLALNNLVKKILAHPPCPVLVVP